MEGEGRRRNSKNRHPNIDSSALRLRETTLRSALCLVPFHPLRAGGAVCELVWSTREGQAHLLWDRAVRMPRPRGATHLQADGRSRRRRSRGIEEDISKSVHWFGFQVNRAIRIEHIMKRGLFGGFGLGMEEVRGLG
jgi:hypothetical protein